MYALSTCLFKDRSQFRDQFHNKNKNKYLVKSRKEGHSTRQYLSKVVYNFETTNELLRSGYMSEEILQLCNASAKEFDSLPDTYIEVNTWH